jgi:hypothetical protein
MYTTRNFKTKKELKQAVEAWVQYRECAAAGPMTVGAVLNAQLDRPPRPVEVYQPNGDLTGTTPPRNGRVYLEGPHYPEPHRWYAQAELKDGVVVKVK